MAFSPTASTRRGSRLAGSDPRAWRGLNRRSVEQSVGKGRGEGCPPRDMMSIKGPASLPAAPPLPRHGSCLDALDAGLWEGGCHAQPV